VIDTDDILERHASDSFTSSRLFRAELCAIDRMLATGKGAPRMELGQARPLPGEAG
jgi:hypothetical protein